ncbi:MAG: hypothetical protein M1827_005367 [Pycnora praestabilis]|nr:MAG: hypothetical protein M1827_005367 [Pycnora praestabilis]
MASTWREDTEPVRVTNPRQPKRPKTANDLIPEMSLSADVQFAAAVTFTGNTNPTINCTVGREKITVLPPQMSHLEAQYDVSSINIISSSKMNTKATEILRRLKTSRDGPAAGRPALIVLTAKVGVASKLIGVVEIVKRAIKDDQGTYYQYNELQSVMVELKGTEEAVEVRVEKDVEIGDGNDDEGEEAFEKMGHKSTKGITERKKVRAIPTMVIYLSGSQIPALAARYGEQTNATAWVKK